MAEKIRILAIAPYAGMEPLLLHVAKEYPNIELVLHVGDLHEGLKIAQSNFHANFDAIFSRGGTAKLLKSAVSLPVIEIKTSVYDVLRTLKLANPEHGKTAVIGFPGITENLYALGELLPYEIDIFTVQSDEQVIPILNRLRNQPYHAILCDVVASSMARQQGINAYLIVSGEESIRTAFETAIFYFENYQHMQSENHFLRQLVQDRESHTIVFLGDGKLFFSTLPSEQVSLITQLQAFVPEVLSRQKQRMVLRAEGALFIVSAKCFSSDELQYIAYYCTERTAIPAMSHCGILYENAAEVEAQYANSFFSTFSIGPHIRELIDRANGADCPVLVSGEFGTGKEQVAQMTYLRSRRRGQPLLQINCTLLGSKVWDFLINHHNSPFCDNDNTIYIQSPDALQPEQQRELLACIINTGLQRRNRLLLSFRESEEGVLSQAARDFLNQLQCFVIALPNMRSNPRHIDTAAKLTLNRLNMERGTQYLVLEPEAMELLRTFYWPQNYMQFARVMDRLAILTDGSTITAQHVREALEKESRLTGSANGPLPALSLLDLSQPLAQIDRSVAELVLQMHGGNHTQTANSLQIGRTTLWRMLRK